MLYYIQEITALELSVKKSYLTTFVILLSVGAILLATGLLAPLYFLETSAGTKPIGIIGGSGVYTYSFLFWTQFNGLWASLTLLGGAMILSSAFALIFHKLISKTCGTITSLHSLALSVFGSTGLIFAIYTELTSGTATMRYPNANLTFCVCSFICLFICFVLLLSYLLQWCKRASFRGLLFETMLTILYFPGCFLFANAIVHILWDILKNYI